MSGAFLDSNILVYCFTLSDTRQVVAKALLDSSCTISVQCLNEFASVARRKLGMSWERLAEALFIMTEVSNPVVPITVDLHRLGLRLAERYNLSVYDGMIAAAALTAECDTLYSEDMHHGLVIGGRVRIVNPFAPA